MNLFCAELLKKSSTRQVRFVSYLNSQPLKVLQTALRFQELPTNCGLNKTSIQIHQLQVWLSCRLQKRRRQGKATSETKVAIGQILKSASHWVKVAEGT
jgi:hypothetical protein